MLGQVINSAIVYLCEQNVTELYVRPTGHVITHITEPGVKFRVSRKESSKFWNDDLIKFAELLQAHVVSCPRCKSEPLGIRALQCFEK